MLTVQWRHLLLVQRRREHRACSDDRLAKHSLRACPARGNTLARLSLPP